MNEEKLPPEDEMDDPDTDSDAALEDEIPKAIPVAEPSVSVEPEPAAPAAPAPPRVFPQQYTLLFASTCILAATLTVWERSHVTGAPDRYGFQMIGGGLVFALAFYCVLTAVVGLMRGGVRFGAPLATGFLALGFAVKTILRLVRLDGFAYYGDLKAKVGWRNGLEAFLGQFGPGIWLAILGGLVIFRLFFKAIMSSGKKAEEAASARRRSRR